MTNASFGYVPERGHLFHAARKAAWAGAFRDNAWRACARDLDECPPDQLGPAIECYISASRANNFAVEICNDSQDCIGNPNDGCEGSQCELELYPGTGPDPLAAGMTCFGGCVEWCRGT